MFKEEINNLDQRIEALESKIEELGININSRQEFENLEAELVQIEGKIDELLTVTSDNQLNQLNSLKKKVLWIKREINPYDEDENLNMMFPNRHDDDFDEDSMSYDSVFGDD